MQKVYNLADGDLQHSYDVLKRYGNMSSPTILFVLKEMLEECRLNNTRASCNYLVLHSGPDSRWKHSPPAMRKFDKRSYQPELLDKDDIPFADIRQNMKELNTINTLLGGHAITLKGIKKLLQGSDKKQPLHICEIGCGGGDNLQAIYRWCSKNNIAVKFTGIDIKITCIEFAAEQYPELPAEWIASDYADVDFKNDKPDIIFNSLFCHHFPEAKILHILHWMQMNSRHWLFHQRSSPALDGVLFY
ncbi:MAG: methyltransferase domain-containing protein [Ferruginibacter sp.]